MHLLRAARIGLLAAAMFIANAAAAYDFEINYHEHVALLSAQNPDNLSFVAFGRQFDVELESNTNIANPSRVSLYRGQLTGVPDSWARISQRGQRLSGAIWDGTELWLLDSHERLNPFLMQPDTAASDATVIFPLSEMAGALSDLVVADWQAPGQTTTSPTPGGTPEFAAASFGPQPGRILDIGLVATADFTARNGAGAQDLILEMFNILEGIYLKQVGVQLRAAEILLLDTDPTELETDDAEDLLGNFGRYKISQPELNSLGLAHLFVSRDLSESDDAEPNTERVGLAFFGSVCSPQFGVGLTQATHSSIVDALIAAHEIGHNLGAPHDNEAGSVCEAEPDTFLMAPFVAANAQFSQCSIEQMLLEIEPATCMPDITPTDLQLSVVAPPPSIVNQDSDIEFQFNLTNLTNERTVGLELFLSSDGFDNLRFRTTGLEESSIGECEQTANEYYCLFPYFNALASVDIRADATAVAPGLQPLTLNVDSLNELDASNNSLQFDIEVAPPSVLTTDFSPIDSLLRPGETVEYELIVRNDGTGPASNVVAFFEFISPVANFLNHFEIDAPECRESGPDRYSCFIGPLGAQTERSFLFALTVPPDIDFELSESAGQHRVRLQATSDELMFPGQSGSTLGTLTVGESIGNLSIQVQGPSSATVGEAATWQFTVTNTGPDALDAVRVFSDRGRAPRSSNVTIEATRGSCQPIGDRADFECTINGLGVGESVTIALTMTPDEAEMGFAIEAFAQPGDASNAVTDPGNNRAEVPFSVAAAAAPPVAPAGGGGGGGSTSLLPLAALFAVIGLRRRMRDRCIVKYAAASA